MRFKNLLKKLNEIEKDCLKLKRQGFYTEYAEGQFDLIQIIKDHIQKKC